MIYHRLGLINKGQKGFTLTDLILAIAITVIITAVITLTVFQVIAGSARTKNHMTAVRQAQSAGYWVSHDAQMAKDVTTDDDLGTPEPELVTLAWTTWEGVANEVIYSLDGTDLIRDHNGDQSSVAQFIQSIEVSPNPYTGGKLTFTVTATVGEQSETRTYEVMPRPGS